MLVSRKIWIGASLLATAGVAHSQQAVTAQPQVADATADFPGGTFSKALKKLLAGEGGEGGLGMTKMHRSVTIPALNDAQIAEVLRGNTLRQDFSFALHFEPQGTFTGWETAWETVDLSRCDKPVDDTYELEEGKCWHASDIKIPAGKWTTRGGMLCTEPAMMRVAEGESCVAMALVLNNVAVFDATGQMRGKGANLVPGKKLEEELK